MTEIKQSSKAIGKSGTELVSGIYTEEYLSKLQGTEAADLYNKMYRADAQIVQLTSAVTNPIKSASWFVEPASDEPADLEKAALMERILFHDIKWAEKLSEMLTFIRHGHAVFEVVHTNKTDKEFGQYTGLAQLGFRSQTTLEKWIVDKTTGELIAIEQTQSGDIEIPSGTSIPVENLLLFFNQREGDNNGYAMFRSLYGPYVRKLLLKELQMIGVERFAIPTPMFMVPSNTDPGSKEYQAAVSLLESWSSGEDSYMLFPEGWGEPIIPSSNFDPTKIQSVVDSENGEMARAFAAGFLQLGQDGAGGAYALSNDLSDFFLAGLDQYAEVIVAEINGRLIPNLMALNFGEDSGPLPELKYSGISDKAGMELSQIIKNYIDAGVVTTDEQLEDYVRKVNKLPKKQEGEMVENQTTDGGSDEPIPSGNDNSNDNNDTTANDDTRQLKERVISLAEAKTPRSLIIKTTDKVREVMQANLSDMADKAIADVMNKYNKLKGIQKSKAARDIKIGGTAKFKRDLKAAYINSASKSLRMAKKEVPGNNDVKLSDKIEGIEIPEGFKFNEKSDLPKHTQILIENLAIASVDTQANDIKNAVAFQFTSSESTTNDADIIRRDLEDRGETYINGGVVQRGAANSSAQVVNDTRNAFFFTPDVLEGINGFKFENSDPKTDICRQLNGKIMNPNDAASFQYSPPLHQNCKSILLPIIIPIPPERITGFNPSDSAIKSITLKDDDNGTN